MQTYKYEELDERGKAFVEMYNDNLIQSTFAESEAMGQVPDEETLINLFEGWRFNEHGEMIA